MEETGGGEEGGESTLAQAHHVYEGSRTRDTGMVQQLRQTLQMCQCRTRGSSTKVLHHWIIDK